MQRKELSDTNMTMIVELSKKKQMVLETLESTTHKSLNIEKSNNRIPKVDEKIGEVFWWNFDFIPSVVYLPFLSRHLNNRSNYWENSFSLIWVNLAAEKKTKQNKVHPQAQNKNIIPG